MRKTFAFPKVEKRSYPSASVAGVDLLPLPLRYCLRPRRNLPAAAAALPPIRIPIHSPASILPLKVRMLSPVGIIPFWHGSFVAFVACAAGIVIVVILAVAVFVIAACLSSAKCPLLSSWS